MIVRMPRCASMRGAVSETQRTLLETGANTKRGALAERKAQVLSGTTYLSRLMSRPCNLGLMVLAVTVALWGISYKLSLYQAARNHTAPVNVAKLWVDSRPDPVPSQSVGDVSPSHSPSPFLPASPRPSGQLATESACHTTITYAVKRNFSSRMATLRSPPLQHC